MVTAKFKKHLSSFALLFSMGISVSYAAQDRCESWSFLPNYPMTISACSYPDGKSGYVVLKNEGQTSADVCYVVVANNGDRDKGCHSRMGAGEVSRVSAVQCGVNTRFGGCSNIELVKYRPN